MMNPTQPPHPLQPQPQRAGPPPRMTPPSPGNGGKKPWDTPERRVSAFRCRCEIPPSLVAEYFSDLNDEQLRKSKALRLDPKPPVVMELGFPDGSLIFPYFWEALELATFVFHNAILEVTGPRAGEFFRDFCDGPVTNLRPDGMGIAKVALKEPPPKTPDELIKQIKALQAELSERQGDVGNVG